MTIHVHRHNSVETAQPGVRTTDPRIVIPERYESSQRVDSLAGVVITPVHHTHTRLHRQSCIYDHIDIVALISNMHDRLWLNYIE